MGKAFLKIRNQMCEVNRRGKYTAESFLSQSFIHPLQSSLAWNAVKGKQIAPIFMHPLEEFMLTVRHPETFLLDILPHSGFSENNLDLGLSFNTWSQYIKSQEKVIKMQPQSSYWPSQQVLPQFWLNTYLWMRLVRGSISFFPSLGSNGVRAPNYSKRSKVS